jgi:hypothetical protein
VSTGHSSKPNSSSDFNPAHFSQWGASPRPKIRGIVAAAIVGCFLFLVIAIQSRTSAPVINGQATGDDRNQAIVDKSNELARSANAKIQANNEDVRQQGLDDAQRLEQTTSQATVPSVTQVIQVRLVGVTYPLQPGIRYGLDMVQGSTSFSILSGAVVVSSPNGQVDIQCTRLLFTSRVATKFFPAETYVAACGGFPATIQVAAINGSSMQRNTPEPPRYWSSPGVGADNNTPVWVPHQSYIYTTPPRGY